MLVDIEELSDEWIRVGYQKQIQDLYLYLYPQKAYVKFRKNHEVIEYATYPIEIAQQVIARFKYLGAMDIGEKRKAQLGAITYRLEDQLIRLRLSTVGDYQGLESLVIRFLSTKKHSSYEQMKHYQQLRQDVITYTGLFLFSGATGSGKTTLMYHLAQQLDGQVITIEDPVEIEQAGFLQLQINEIIGQTYDELIKLALRHRPDLMIIGEIRDHLTAKSAIRAALTGHQVFATIHAKSVTTTVTRLLELGCSQWEMENTIQGICYQQTSLENDQEKRMLSYQSAKQLFI